MKNIEESLSIDLKHWFKQKLALINEISIDCIETDIPIVDYGLDSMHSMVIAGELEDLLEIEISSTLLWDYPTIDKVTTFLENQIV